MPLYVFFSSPDPLQDKENQQHTEEENEYRQWGADEDNEEDRAFWEEPTLYTPESRLETHRYIEEKRRAKEDLRYLLGFTYSLH